MTEQDKLRNQVALRAIQGQTMSTYPEGSCLWRDLKVWGDRVLEKLALNPMPTTMPKGWKVRVGRYHYSEKWLRIYAALRHHSKCFCLASDYANHMAPPDRPIVYTKKLDLALLAAHCRIPKGIQPNKGKENCGQSGLSKRHNAPQSR